MRRTATLLIAAAGLGWFAAPALAAAGDPTTGYWARTRTGLPVPLQPPDPVPEGGTWVASDPSGPVAVSALRTGLGPALVAVELRLTVADALGAPAVQACPSSDSWAPEQGGRLEGAPVADCSVPLEAIVDGGVLVVPLPPGLDVVNVLLRPKPGSAFSLTLERAPAASVVTAPQAAPAPAPATLALPAGRPRPAVLPDDRTQDLLAVAVLALLGAQAVRLALQPAVAPRALGGSARRTRVEPEAEVLEVLVPARGVGRFRTEPVLGVRTPPERGVGRFRTVRTRPPVRI
jgi:hypothetical protein